MSKLIVGVVPSSDAEHVKSVVLAAGLEPSRVKVLSAHIDDEDSPITFLQVADLAQHDVASSMTHGTGVLAGVGTSVPGLSDTRSLDAFSHPRVHNYFRGTALPRGAAEGYNDALAGGKCVVLYDCDIENSVAAQSAMERAGIIEVRVF